MTTPEQNDHDPIGAMTRFRILPGVTPYAGRKFPGVWDSDAKESVTLYISSAAGNSILQADGRTYLAEEVRELPESAR